MTYTLSIDPQDLAKFESSIRAKLEAARQPVQAAMAGVMETIVLNNFGSTDFMRPWEWQPLSPAYAKKVGRPFATLLVTGALKSTVRKNDTDPEGASVTMSNTGDVPYVMAHHNGYPGNFGWTEQGSGELPARRVFPMEPYADTVIPEAVDLVTQAAVAKIKELFQ